MIDSLAVDKPERIADTLNIKLEDNSNDYLDH
jgi:hypothetical protein